MNRPMVANVMHLSENGDKPRQSQHDFGTGSGHVGPRSRGIEFNCKSKPHPSLACPGPDYSMPDDYAI